MAKIKLGQQPKSFAHVVKFAMLDGSEGLLPVTYRYRTRREYAEFVDARIAKARAEVAQPAPAESDDQTTELFSLLRATEKADDAVAEYVMEIVEGWGLDEEFNAANIAQLHNEIPAATAALIEAYRRACVEGRLGN